MASILDASDLAWMIAMTLSEYGEGERDTDPLGLTTSWSSVLNLVNNGISHSNGMKVIHPLDIIVSHSCPPSRRSFKNDGISHSEREGRKGNSLHLGVVHPGPLLSDLAIVELDVPNPPQLQHELRLQLLLQSRLGHLQKQGLTLT